MIQINLTDDEALVLFERLSRLIHDENGKSFAIEAEEFTACSILCQLESTLTAPLADDYAECLEKARTKLTWNTE